MLVISCSKCKYGVCYKCAIENHNIQTLIRQLTIENMRQSLTQGARQEPILQLVHSGSGTTEEDPIILKQQRISLERGDLALLCGICKSEPKRVK